MDASSRVALIRGTGDVASAVAVFLRAAGFRVVLHDDPRPTHTRRGMAFADALYDGCSRLVGVLGRRVRTLDDLPHMVRCAKALPVTSMPFDAVTECLRAHVLIDARMRKRSVPESQRGLARTTIGLGPNFEAGENIDIAIETAWGAELGRPVLTGRTQALAGEPMPLAGHARDRYVYSPAAGVFRTRRAIGDLVSAGDCVGDIDGIPICAPLTGCLRGLTHDGASVSEGTKIVEVDASADASRVFGLSERPRRIARGVCEALGVEVLTVGE